MSRETVNQIIDRAVADETYFELLRTNPDAAVAGYALDPQELSALRAGAYNVVVRATRREREEQAPQKAPAAVAAPAVVTPPPANAAQPSAPSPARLPVGGLVGFFAGLLVIGAGLGGFRFVERQWPWEALGLTRTAQATIPVPSLGARPKPSGPAQASSAARAPASAGTASTAPSARAGASPASSPSGQAQLRSPASSAAPSAAASQAAQADADRQYYQAVGMRLAGVMQSFTNVVTALRASNDPSKDLNDLSGRLSDLQQHLGDAPPPDRLQRQHQTLGEAIPVLQADVDQMKTALSQKNAVRAQLVAIQMDAVLNQTPDEVAFANAPDPEIYQPINSVQPLAHVLNFDVLSQSVTARNNAPANVQQRIGLQSANPSSDEVADTLRHSIVAARQTFPQAGQVHVVAFTESNGNVAGQAGTADWYCSSDARPPDASASTSWQDSCSKIYINAPSGNSQSATSVVPY